MKKILLIDFGSTFTKVTAVDVDTPMLIGTAQAWTTVTTDLSEGLHLAMERLFDKVGRISFAETYACSSAAGGLRMVASGLVPTLTSEAARLACLGAGAKLVGQYSYEMTREDVEEINRLRPDIFLLVGGTDGGNKTCILHNAGLLTALAPNVPIIIAGNRVAAGDCAALLKGHPVHVCANVMPAFGKINIEEVQACIRKIFLENIVRAKGLSDISGLLDDIIMPTPSAVMAGMQLLADGTGNRPGIGELVGIDVGGATTDIYSVADGMPRHSTTVYKGLPEPYVKRTVEGDIGMRYSVKGIVEAAGTERIAALAGISADRVTELADLLSRETDLLPDGNPELLRLDQALASAAVECAVRRHAGQMEETYTMMGLTHVQSGKDLRNVKQIVVTGGSLIHTANTEVIASHALFNPADAASLRPEHALVRVDRQYIIAAMGLLSQHYPDAALTIMKEELENGDSEQAYPTRSV